MIAAALRMAGRASVLTAGIMVLAAGCGLQPARHGAHGAASVPSSAAATCVTPKLTAGRTFSISERDAGRTFCVTVGTGVYVFLHGTGQRMWSAIRPTSPVLAREPSGIMTLARGVTGGYFKAERLGTAKLTSALPPCHLASGATSPPAAHCGAGTLFTVTIVVLGRM